MLEVCAFVHREVKGFKFHLALAVSLTGKDSFSLSLSFFLFPASPYSVVLLLSHTTLTAALYVRYKQKQGIQCCSENRLSLGALNAGFFPARGKHSKCIFELGSRLYVLNNWHIYYSLNRKLHMCRLKTSWVESSAFVPGKMTTRAISAISVQFFSPKLSVNRIRLIRP